MTKEFPTETDDRKKFAVWLDKTHLLALRTIQERIGAPISESIRRAISEYLEKEEIAAVLRRKK
jgi:hypothetical protein